MPEENNPSYKALHLTEFSLRSNLAGELGRYCDTMSYDLLLNSNLEVVGLAMV
jgi:hypothetical protein